MSAAAPLDLRNLTVAYHQHIALSNANVAVTSGQVTALLGPNGAGKSTLLKAAMGLLPIAGGEVLFFGERLNKVRQQVGYMSQAAEVDWDFPASVRDVVTMGVYGRLGWLRRPTKAHTKIVDDALEMVGLTDLARRQISQLSGGQKQRTFIARILAQQPDLFLLDEPLAGVDIASQETILSIIAGLRQAGKTIVMVHHELATVSGFADQVVLLKDGLVIDQGALDQAFTPESVMRAYGLDVLGARGVGS